MEINESSGEIFLAMPDQVAFALGHSAVLGIRCAECGEEQAVMNISSASAIELMLVGGMMPEMFECPPDKTGVVQQAEQIVREEFQKILLGGFKLED